MYKLISRYKNEVIRTDSERKRDRLLDLGYTLVEETEKKINLDKMTVEQLEAYAREKGIDLSDCGNKAEKTAKIKAATAQ